MPAFTCCMSSACLLDAANRSYRPLCAPNTYFSLHSHDAHVLQVFFSPEIAGVDKCLPLPVAIDMAVQSTPIDARRSLYKVSQGLREDRDYKAVRRCNRVRHTECAL